MSSDITLIQDDKVFDWPEKPLPQPAIRLHKPQPSGVSDKRVKEAALTAPKPRPTVTHPNHWGEKYFKSDRVPALALRPTNPKRPPNWRWQLARHIVESPSPSIYRCGDEHSARAISLQKVLRRCSQEDHIWQVLDCATPWPEMFEALQIWHDDDLFRAELEARVLADEEPVVIARKLSTTPEVINQYESVFFDVRGSLACPGYVIHTVLGSKIQGDLSAEDLPLLWKHLAYGSRSGEVVDMLVYGFPSSRNRSTSENPADFFQSDAKQTLALKSWLAMRTLPTDDPKVATRLVRQLGKLEQQKARPKARRLDTNINIEKNVSAFFSSIESSFNGDEMKILYEQLEPQGSQIAATDSTNPNSAPAWDPDELYPLAW